MHYFTIGFDTIGGFLILNKIEKVIPKLLSHFVILKNQIPTMLFQKAFIHSVEETRNTETVLRKKHEYPIRSELVDK